ncbi:unnamed protein product [Somion occarium]|uniref:NET domain-containing protein n=1 Tax=Somion occarium TaxID=3059160 RepID=A0ABP1CEF4_9APHY
MGDTTIERTARKSREGGKLDVEDEEQRQARMHNVLTQLDSKASRQAQAPPRPFEFGDRKTFAVEPPSELLCRLQSFLPELAASNAELVHRAREDPRSVDIENVEDESRYIEMNLGLGVFEDHSKTHPQTTGNSTGTHPGLDVDMSDDARTSSRSYGSTDSTSDSDSEMSEDDSSDSDTSSVDIISDFASTISRPIRPLPRRTTTRPAIIVLDDGNSKDERSSHTSEESQ